MSATTGITVAVDAMGGDHAPDAVVAGAVTAVESRGCRVILVGRRDAVETSLRRCVQPPDLERVRSRIEVFEASEVVEMDEHPAQAVRAKRDSSIVRACELAAQGRAQAVVSAGNSGAVLAAALFTLRRIPGIARPAIGALLPGRDDARTFLLDVGANADVRAEWLAQFAVMGSVYARTMMGVADPRVALLSNGEEPGKGSALIQAAHPLLAAAPIRFTGNIEGRDLLSGRCDVAVTDGFTGNVALKTAEGVGEYLFAVLRHEARTSRRAMLGGLLLKPRLRAVRDRVDYRATGGALLLGVAGEVVIAHGRSDATAIDNAIGVAATAVQHHVSGTIAAAMPREVVTPALAATTEDQS
ncbi:MAG TPA: phosphate acyltransferase PlsX [Candidatus Dormibacteraeota bacterium]